MSTSQPAMSEDAQRIAPEVLYFGCLGEAGHYLHSKQNPCIRYNETPWRNSLDGGILERHKRLDNGQAVHAILGGWSAINFWDNSVDTRGGSHSAFLVREILPPEEILRLAQAQWPEVFSRPRFPKVTLVDSPTAPTTVPNQQRKL